jgi:hypothetical protein
VACGAQEAQRQARALAQGSACQRGSAITRFLRRACPACWLLDVSRLIASRMVFRAQGESAAPRS